MALFNLKNNRRRVCCCEIHSRTDDLQRPDRPGISPEFPVALIAQLPQVTKRVVASSGLGYLNRRQSQ